MGKKQPTQPAPVDPTIAITAQKNANIQGANASAALDHTNQVTPWGNLTWSNVKGQSHFDQAGYDAAVAKAASSNSGGHSFWRDSIQAGTPMANNFNPLSAYDHSSGGAMVNGVSRDTYTTYDPDTWSSKVDLSPDQQKLFDQQNASSLALGNTSQKLLGNVDQSMATPLNFNGLNGVRNDGVSDSTGDTGDIQSNVDMDGRSLRGAMSEAQNAAYNQAASRLDPQWQQSNHDLQNQLTQQGIMQNSDAWNRATSQQSRNQNDAYQTAQNNAVQQGNAAQAQLYGQYANNMQQANSAQSQRYQQGMANAQLRNSASGQDFSQSMAARNQGMNELMTLRSNPLNELNALRNGSQVTAPTFGSGGNFNIGGVDAMGAINQGYNQQMGLYNSKVGENNATTGAIGTTIGTLGAAFL